VFEGYFDRVEEEYITTTNGSTSFSYLNVETPYASTMDNLILERDLQAEQAFQFRVFPEFDITELGLVRSLLPIDAGVNLIPFLVPNQGKPTDLAELLGDVIIGNDPNLRRVYPTVGLAAFVDTGISVIAGLIAKVRSTSVAFGFQTNTANQILAINSAGNLYPVSSLRSNERQRALISTVTGESKASTFSAEIEGNANPNISVDLTYPTSIRANYSDVIASSTEGDFNAEEIVFYVRKRNSEGGGIVETRRFTGFSPTNTTSDVFSFLYENGTIYAGAIPSAEFGLFTPATLLAGDLTVQSTTGTFYFDFAVSFKYNGTSITGISHKTTDGCVSELIENISTIATNSNYFKPPVADITALTATLAANLTNSAIYPVTSVPALYMYKNDSVATANGSTVVACTNGSGRFILI
jgi:hypothetical protein